MSVTTTPGAPAGVGRAVGGGQPGRVGGGLLDARTLWKATPDAFKKLDPRVQLKNPVMFVVEVGAALTTYTAITKPSVFNWTIVVFLWLTVLFANLAEAVAEGRGKAQAETLRRTKRETVARKASSGSALAPNRREIRVGTILASVVTSTGMRRPSAARRSR